MFRIITEVRPAWVIGENVANFTKLAFTRTKVDLESKGYRVQPFVIPSSAVSAPHRRDRIFIITHNDSNDSPHGTQGFVKEKVRGIPRIQGFQNVRRVEDFFGRPDIPQPLIRGTRDGVPHWVDRLKCVGNSVNPKIIEIIGQAVIQSYRGDK